MQNGTKVRGVYYGHAWTGVVYHSEPSWTEINKYHGPCNHYYVKLDTPLQYFGEREDLALLDMIPNGVNGWKHYRNDVYLISVVTEA